MTIKRLSNFLFSASALRNSPVLSELRLGWCNINGEVVNLLTETLKSVQTMKVLDISGCTVNSVAAKNIGA